eukprot:c29149_g1_i3 orf=206-1237(-)
MGRMSVLQLSCPSSSLHSFFALVFLFCFSVVLAGARSGAFFPHARLLVLSPDTPLILQYHNGPLLTEGPAIGVYIIWYGKFSPAQRSIVTDYLASLQSTHADNNRAPDPAMNWWKIMTGYKDKFGASVSGSVQLLQQAYDEKYSLGKNINRTDIEALINAAIQRKSLPYNPQAVYLVLTADDVFLERFCMDSCGFHDYTFPSRITRYRSLLYGWVGNSAKQCPGQCAWPFARPQYGPPNPPLLPPNGDIGVDGMVINIAAILAGAATNPYGTGLYQGDAAAPSEAATACSGIFGKGAYPGYPGDLPVSQKTGASYNVNGINNRQFLLPAVWNPNSLTCETQSS